VAVLSLLLFIMTVDSIITFVIGGNVAEQIHIIIYIVPIATIVGAQEETKTRPRNTLTRPSRPEREQKKTYSRLKGDLIIATSVGNGGIIVIVIAIVVVIVIVIVIVMASSIDRDNNNRHYYVFKQRTI
jgi:hypothetical protein